LHRLAELLVLLDGHHHRYHLAAMTNHVVGVTGGQFAHERHGNEVDRQHVVATRRRSTIKVQAKAGRLLSWEPVSGSKRWPAVYKQYGRVHRTR
jgi:hypothetical protein